jgi:hypothetical protein
MVSRRSVKRAAAKLPGQSGRAGEGGPGDSKWKPLNNPKQVSGYAFVRHLCQTVTRTLRLVVAGAKRICQWDVIPDFEG